MISQNEIIELEQKYHNYLKNKKIFKNKLLYIIIAIFFTIIAISSFKIIKNPNEENKKITQKMSKKDYKKENIKKDKTSEDSIFLNYNLDVIDNIQKNIMKSKKIDNAAKLKETIEQINVEKSKSNLKIEVQEDSDIFSRLKDSFENTKNIKYAIDLANEYYKTGNYKESNKWAIIANDVDSNNVQSWIIFAKSQYKLQNKDNALKALRTFNKNRYNSDIQKLIKQIESDKL